MRGIGGNISAKIQNRTMTTNDIGEQTFTWTDAQNLKGWLDQASGSSTYQTYSTKIEESTHIFICDYVALASGVSAENSRMVIGSKTYDILDIDNPMEMQKGSQWEFSLKFTGCQ